MKVGIAFFSGTGNTRHIARQFEEAFTVQGHHVSCARMETLLAGDVQAWCQGQDLVGLGHPVHAFGEPRIVAEFLKRLGKGSSQRIFLFTTSAGGEGRVHARLRRRLARSGYDVVGESKYHPKCDYFFYASHHKQTAAQIERRFAGLDEEISLHVAQLLEGRRVYVKPRWFEWLLPNRALSAVYKRGCRWNGRFFRTTDACTNCGLCAELCPTGNIVVSNGRPAFGSACTVCLRCMAICPVGAVQLGPIRKQEGTYLTPGFRTALVARDDS